MHGCPPNEIEAIVKYLIAEEGLHTYVKLNPTLLGFETVRKILSDLGYSYIELDRKSFEHDLQFEDAIPMLKRLIEFASKHKKEFGVKLSNTLGVKNLKQKLPGGEMYMSGRSLFPLTINLAYKLSLAFNGGLKISYSGGANYFNVEKIFETGIYPITFATDLLKPGGYFRLLQITNLFEGDESHEIIASKINLEKLKTLADDSLQNSYYKKSIRDVNTLKISKQLERFDCYVAPCEVACPIHQDVSEYIHLVEQKRFEDAFEVIIQKNPLPYITGYICDHQCTTKCTRWDYDEPLLIREIKKVAAENGYEKYLEKFKHERLAAQNNIKVAIIGAGPSGLAAGYFLSRAGFDVTIFEKTDKAGGTVQHVIPSFRIPQSVIDKDVEFIQMHGVKFEFNSCNISIERLKENGFKYIYVAIGAPLSNELKLKGNNQNIFDAIEFLKSFNKNEQFELGKNVAVIGGGNSAMDGARAAIRTKGVENVFVIYRRIKEFMPADREELNSALEEGIVFKELLLPIEFNDNWLKCQKMKLSEFEVDGRRNVELIENEFETLEVDSIITAIGEHVDSEFLKSNKIDMDDKNKIIIQTDSNETTTENVFIGGDALRGPSTVVESIADGKKAAEAIIKKEKMRFSFDTAINSPRTTYDERRIINIDHIKGNLLKQSNSDIVAEALRCLGCDLICNKCVEVCPNRANIAIAVNDGFKDKFQILHIDGMCNECGNCETFCPYQGSPYKDKFTLFWSEDEFYRSSNDGIYSLKITTDEVELLVKINGKVQKAIFNRDESSHMAVHSQIEVKEIGEIYSNDFTNYKKIISRIIKDYNYLLLSTSQKSVG